MAGTPEGGRKAAATNRALHSSDGIDFYRMIGAKGGANSRGGGFAMNPELAARAGRLGGKISRRNQATREGRI